MLKAKKIPLIIIAGPTSAGKSDIAVRLAKMIGGEIISADSIQVYRGMDIGSGKITPDEMEGIPHYLIDILDPKDDFNITMFQKLAKEAVFDISSRGKIPILVGGTGFYIQSLIYDIDFTSQPELDEFRKELQKYADEYGARALHERLRAVDPKSAEKIHENNIKRTIRAIEFYEFTGKQISEHNERQRQNESPYDFWYFVITDDRQELYERINRRVDKMLDAGLVQEVRGLREAGCTLDMTSMQGLGYKEIYECLEGRLTLEEAVYKIKRDTRHFAKRQLTWFRRERDVIWVDRRDFKDDEKIAAHLLDICKEGGERTL